MAESEEVRIQYKYSSLRELLEAFHLYPIDEAEGKQRRQNIDNFLRSIGIVRKKGKAQRQEVEK